MSCCYQCSVVCLCVCGVLAWLSVFNKVQCSVVCLCVCWSQPWSIQKQRGIWPIVTSVPWSVCVCVLITSSQPWSLQNQHGIWPIVTSVPWSVCVCVLVITMNPTKTAWDMACCYQCSLVCLYVCWSQPWSIQKQQNWQRWCLRCGLRWTQGTVSYVGAQIPQGEWAILGTSPAHCEV